MRVSRASAAASTRRRQPVDERPIGGRRSAAPALLASARHLDPHQRPRDRGPSRRSTRASRAWPTQFVARPRASAPPAAATVPVRPLGAPPPRRDAGSSACPAGGTSGTGARPRRSSAVSDSRASVSLNASLYRLPYDRSPYTTSRRATTPRRWRTPTAGVRSPATPRMTCHAATADRSASASTLCAQPRRHSATSSHNTLIYVTSWTVRQADDERPVTQESNRAQPPISGKRCPGKAGILYIGLCRKV